MKLSHRFLAVLLALVMILSLCACGGKTDNPETTTGNTQNGSQNNDQPGDNTETSTPKEDTWENAMGQSGVMEYEYKGDKLKKATFKYGNTDKVWRTIEYGSFEDNAVGMRYYETHRNSNQEVTFSLDIRYFEDEGAKNVPQYITGHDYFYDETSCDLTLQSDGLIIETMIANTYDGAQDFWITSYADNGLPAKTSVYSREGTLLCTWLFYHEDGRVAYGKEVEDYIILDADYWGTVYKFDYNDNGELVALIEGYGAENSDGEITGFDPKEQHDPENPIGITFEYDAQGRLAKRIKTGSNTRTTQVFTYSDDGTVAECDFISGRVDSDNDHHTCFKMNSDSVLSSADFGYLSNADTSYYEFEYFDNGMLSHIKAYDRSTVKEGDEYLDIEWENEFYESGKLKTNTTYDSYDMTYHTRYYDEEGEKTDMIGGTYTGDGQKTPD